MFRIVESILEIAGGESIWGLVDEETGSHIGYIEPESIENLLQRYEGKKSEESGIKDEELENEEEEVQEQDSEERESQFKTCRIPLTEKRFLDIAEFQQYTSLGKNRAADLAKTSGCIFRFGRRKMIDRIKFDKWCDAH